MASKSRIALRLVVCTGLLLALGMVATALAAAQQPVAPANGERIDADQVVLKWALAQNTQTWCVEWSLRPTTSGPGGPFYDPEGAECDLDPFGRAYRLDLEWTGTYYWHVQVAPLCFENECTLEGSWGPTAYFKSVAPTGCNQRAAAYFAENALLPAAQRRLPSSYKGIVGRVEWFRTLRCRDLTGDREREMIVQLRCCTGGSRSPWAIFKQDRVDQWRMAYAQVRDTVFRLGFRGRSVRTMMPAPYEGACTTHVRYRVVRWSGTRFRSQLTRRHRAPSRC